MLAESRTFTRYNSTDETLEFSTPGPNAATLAYLDHNADGTADVVVFNPYKGTRRHYDGRNPVRALAIIRRHLASEGYEMPALEEAAAEISAYDVKRGDKFTYCGTEYEAVADATGEFNAYCRVWNPRRREVTEILMRHGSIVTLLERSTKWEVLGNGEAHGAYATRGAAQAMADRMNEASDVRDAAGRIIPVFHVAPQQA